MARSMHRQIGLMYAEPYVGQKWKLFSILNDALVITVGYKRNLNKIACSAFGRIATSP